jgi:hypothetical protein
MNNFFAELKRRNIAVANAVVPAREFGQAVSRK